jgi:prepilin-type N-terminal cleavage/methylation domain-containing protein
MKRAFTLIELLVVIAIIAILAAILFPVFAQAKEAAKKTAALSQTKQFGTGAAVYLADADDNMPLAMTTSASGAQRYGTIHPFPSGSVGAGWDAPGIVNDVNTYWANSLYPYIKNFDIYNYNGQLRTTIPGETFSTNVGAPRPQHSGLSYNGLLHSMSATAIEGVSVVPMFWGGQGNVALNGRAGSNPALLCDQPGVSGVPVPCRFNPAGHPQTGNTAAGFVSATYGFGNFNGGYKVWPFAKGSPIVRSDTSAKYQRVGNLETKLSTDPSQGFGSAFVDPFNKVYPGAAGMGFGYWGCNNGGTVGDGFDAAGPTSYYHCFFRPDRVK